MEMVQNGHFIKNNLCLTVDLEAEKFIIKGLQPGEGYWTVS